MKAGNTGRGKEPADLTETLSGRRLSALLSPVLIAFTVEADNEFELQMVAAGHPGAGLSLGVWSNALRFVPENGVTVRELAAAALTHVEEKVFQLGCLERWGFITLEASAGDSRPIRRKFHRQANRELRDGWGSGRGIRPEWMVRCTAKGRAAVVIWPELSETIEARWKGRFGAETVDRLRKALVSIVGEFKSELLGCSSRELGTDRRLSLESERAAAARAAFASTCAVHLGFSTVGPSRAGPL